MEELAKLEAERGTPGYAAGGKGILADERKGQNRAGKNGGGTVRGDRRKERQDCQQRDVYVFDFEYFLVAADTCEYDCLQAAVRECESGRDYCAGDCCDVY